jgi:hypothetical protein
MRNLRRRLRVLERLPQLQLPPNRLEQIISLALRSLSQEDLELLPVAEMRARALSDDETGACGAWLHALETEARQAGFRSFAEAERTVGQRR